MTINLKAPELRELKPRIMVCGVGGAGGNAVNNMIVSGLVGVDFVVANTDAQALTSSRAERIIQMGLQVTEGLGAGSQPEVGRAAAEEAIEEIRDHLAGAHMCFVTAGMGGGTGTGAAPVIARTARDMGILTVGVVTKPFTFEGQRRMRVAEAGITELQKSVDTLIVIPNQNLFRVANEKTTFADAFSMADQVLYSGVACITDLMVKEGLINLDFADVRAIMREMGKAMMGTGEASGDKRAILAAEAAIANPLLDEVSMKGARGLLISITGGNDLTLYEVDEAASRIRQEVDEEANIILGATFDSSLEGIVRVSVVATGIDTPARSRELNMAEDRIKSAAEDFRNQINAPRPSPATPVRAPAQPAAPAYETQPAAWAPTEYAPQPQVRQAPAQPAPQPAPQQAYEQPRAYAQPQTYAQPQPQTMREPAPQPMPQARREVQIEMAPPRPVVYDDAPAPRARQMEPQDETAFIPPQPESGLVRPVKLPTVDDLPRHMQDHVRQHQGGRPVAPVQPVQDKRQSLLEKLASFGRSRTEDERPAAPQQRPQSYQQPVQGRGPAAPSPIHNVYGNKPSAGGAPRVNQASLDTTGRITRVPHRPSDEDDVEIPAFLRRQSN